LINFRYHVVSLIAVFLALAVGVVMGYGVLGQPTVDTLQRRVDTVEQRSNEIRGENDVLRAEQARLEEGLYELAAIHLSSEPPRLHDAALAIDAVGCLVEGLGPRLGDEHATLAEALSNIRLAFVQIKGLMAEGDDPDA